MYKVRIDSFIDHQRDSVYIRKDGDTVYITKTSIAYKYQLKIVKDTIIDTLRVQLAPETKIVERTESWFSKTMRYSGCLLWITLLLYAVYRYLKYKLKPL